MSKMAIGAVVGLSRSIPPLEPSNRSEATGRLTCDWFRVS